MAHPVVLVRPRLPVRPVARRASRPTDVWLLVASAVVYVVSMALTVLDGVTGVMRGYEAFLLGFAGLLEGSALGLYALPNVLHLLALALGWHAAATGRDRIVHHVLSAAALCGALLCLLSVPSLVGHPGWWAWAGSFALLAAARVRPGGVFEWLIAPRLDRRGEALRVVAFALPASVAGSALLVPLAGRLVPRGLVVSPAVAVVCTVVGCAVGAGVALRLHVRAARGG